MKQAGLGGMVPSVLYKYVVPERIDVLREKRIRFTQPCFLNDPFEFLLGGPDDPAHFEAKCDRKRQAEFLEKSRLYGVVSLTRRNNSIPMWTFYAASHRGFAIGFDTTSSFFRRAIDDRNLRRVDYGSQRVISTRGLPPDQPWVKPDAVLLMKSADWKHEEEWRWIDCCGPDGYDEVGSTPNGEPVYLRSIPPGSILEVILGCRATSDLAESIHALKSTAEYQHLKVLKVALSRSRYDLEIEAM
jgi:hypothetical protein